MTLPPSASTEFLSPDRENLPIPARAKYRDAIRFDNTRDLIQRHEFLRTFRVVFHGGNSLFEHVGMYSDNVHKLTWQPIDSVVRYDITRNLRNTRLEISLIGGYCDLTNGC